jgi:hypothetical protein
MEAAEAEIAKLRAKHDELGYAQKQQRKSALRKQVRQLSEETYSFDESVDLLSASWATTHADKLRMSLEQGAQSLGVLIADDLADTTQRVYDKTSGSILPGFAAGYRVELIDDSETRDVIRYTQGYRAGEICSMPALGSANTKSVCL